MVLAAKQIQITDTAWQRWLHKQKDIAVREVLPFLLKSAVRQSDRSSSKDDY